MKHSSSLFCTCIISFLLKWGENGKIWEDYDTASIKCSTMESRVLTVYSGSMRKLRLSEQEQLSSKYIWSKLETVITYSTLCSVNLKINEIKYTESTRLFRLLSCRIANLTNTLQLVCKNMLFILTLFVNLGQRYTGVPCKMTTREVIQLAELKPKDLTIVLTLSAKVLDVIFLPGTWNGFDTASTYAAWNFLKNWE